MTDTTHITHARTVEELRQELLSDLRRRIEILQGQGTLGVFGRGAAAKARVDGRINELESMLRFWTAIEIVPAGAAKKKVIV